MIRTHARGRYVDRKYAMYMMTKGGEHDERKEVREGGRERRLASVIGDIGSQSSVVLVLAQVGRLSQPEGGRERGRRRLRWG